MTTASYAPGDCVLTLGSLWIAQIPIAPGPWNPTQWVEVGATGDFLPLGGGTLSGPLTLSGNATNNLHAVPLQQIATELGAYLPLTAGVAAPLSGELYLPAPNPSGPLVAAHRAYVDAGDAALQGQIDLLSSNLLFAGGIDVPADNCTFTAASGQPNGVLPDADNTNRNMYLIVTVGGSGPGGASNVPAGDFSLGDWIVSTGTTWIGLPTGQAGVTASNVSINPTIGALGANVQTGLAWLDEFKLDLAGGAMTGPLTMAADPAGPLEPVTLGFLDNITIDAGTFT